jgi:hypothetical protein
MPIEPHTKPEHVRYAPGFSSSPAGGEDHKYTVQALAKFLGLLKPGNRQEPRNSFVAAFGAVELISEGYLTEERKMGETPKV